MTLQKKKITKYNFKNKLILKNKLDGEIVKFKEKKLTKKHYLGEVFCV